MTSPLKNILYVCPECFKIFKTSYLEQIHRATHPSPSGRNVTSNPSIVIDETPSNAFLLGADDMASNASSSQASISSFVPGSQDVSDEVLLAMPVPGSQEVSDEVLLAMPVPEFAIPDDSLDAVLTDLPSQPDVTDEPDLHECDLRCDEMVCTILAFCFFLNGWLSNIR